MRKVFGVLFLLGALAMLAVPALAASDEVKVAVKGEMGTYLTDSAGKTLYWYMKDSPAKSACTGPCVDKWPLYYREKVVPPECVGPEAFGSILREDGKKQTTFKGYPLYYWVNDKAAGDTLGQGVNGVWYVIDPSNFPPKKQEGAGQGM